MTMPLTHSRAFDSASTQAHKEASYLKEEKYVWPVECLASEAIRRMKEGKTTLESDSESEGESDSDSENDEEEASDEDGSADGEGAVNADAKKASVNLANAQFDDEDDEEDSDYVPSDGGH